MSISDMIVVMKEGTLQQLGKPQEIYDDPTNLFVAKFLGTPPINVFEATVKDEMLYIGDEPVLSVKGVSDRRVWAGVRPEGFIPSPQGKLTCQLKNVEVMGRDTSIVASHEAFSGENIRAIISAETTVDKNAETVKFNLRSGKVHIFDYETEERIRFGEA